MDGSRRAGVDLSAPRVQTKYAPVMELVDMRDLGSRAAMRVGSSPFRRTIFGASDMALAPSFLYVKCVHLAALFSQTLRWGAACVWCKPVCLRIEQADSRGASAFRLPRCVLSAGVGTRTHMA